MSMNWYPMIDQEKCTQCGVCVDFCTNGVYEYLTQQVVVKHPENCPDGCRGCASQCPVGAISHHGNPLQTSSCSCGCSCSEDKEKKDQNCCL